MRLSGTCRCGKVVSADSRSVSDRHFKIGIALIVLAIFNGLR
jgi:hypothetical protein